MATKNFKAMNLNSMLMKADTVTSTPKVSSGLESLTKPVSMRKLAAFDTGIKKEETKISNVETVKVTQSKFIIVPVKLMHLDFWLFIS